MTAALSTNLQHFENCPECGKKALLSNEDYTQPEGQIAVNGTLPRHCSSCVGKDRLRLALQLQQKYRGGAE